MRVNGGATCGAPQHTHCHTHSPRLLYSVDIPGPRCYTPIFIPYLISVLYNNLPWSPMHVPSPLGVLNRTRVPRKPSTLSTSPRAPPACSPFVPRDHDVITWVATAAYHHRTPNTNHIPSPCTGGESFFVDSVNTRMFIPTHPVHNMYKRSATRRRFTPNEIYHPVSALCSSHAMLSVT